MRKLIFLITFVLTLIINSVSIFGQQNRARDAEYFPRHEIYVQYGTPTILELTSTLSPSTANEERKVIAKNVVFSGVGGVGYSFSVSEMLSIGIYGGVSLASANIYSSMNDLEFPEYSSHIVKYTGQLSANWTYYEEGAIQISSAAYLGLSFNDMTIKPLRQNTILPDSNKPLELAYHLTVIKLRYGNIVGGFAELGFGFRGLVNVGLSIML